MKRELFRDPKMDEFEIQKNWGRYSIFDETVKNNTKILKKKNVKEEKIERKE